MLQRLIDQLRREVKHEFIAELINRYDAAQVSEGVWKEKSKMAKRGRQKEAKKWRRVKRQKDRKFSLWSPSVTSQYLKLQFQSIM